MKTAKSAGNKSVGTISARAGASQAMRARRPSATTEQGRAISRHQKPGRSSHVQPRSRSSVARGEKNVQRAEAKHWHERVIARDSRQVDQRDAAQLDVR